MTARQSEKIDKVMTDIYQELYENSTPKGDFKTMVENAKLNERGQKIIPYNEYEIEEDVFEEIVDRHLKATRFVAYIKKSIRNGVLLGCSPKFKR